MSWITLVITWFQMQGSNLSGNAWGYEFWKRVLAMNIAVGNFFWTIFWIVVGLAVLSCVINFLRGRPLKESFTCLGCAAIFLILLPLGQLINVAEARGILASFSPVTGITNQTNFFVSLVLFLFVGVI